MPLPIVDGNGNPATLKTSTDGSDLVPHHKIDGTVAAAVTGTVDLAAGSQVVGSFAAVVEGAVPGDGLRVAGTKLPVKRAKAAIASATTDGAIVAAVATKVLRVLAVILHCGGTATTVTFNSKGAGAGTAISQVFALAANQNVVLPHLPDGWFETTAGEGLTGTTGSGSTVGITVIYVEV